MTGKILFQKLTSQTQFPACPFNGKTCKHKTFQVMLKIKTKLVAETITTKKNKIVSYKITDEMTVDGQC
jgi:hypothetical protein